MSLLMIGKAFGLGDTIDKIQAMVDNGTIAKSVAILQEMATDGTLDKIYAFAVGIDQVNAKMDRILYLLEGDKSNGRNLEPGAGAGNGTDCTPRIVEGSFERPEPIRQSEPVGIVNGGHV